MSLPCVRIAHFSDPHLPLAELPGWRELGFKRILSLLSWSVRRRKLHRWAPLEAVMRDIARARPDLVALTGDLTNLGLLAEFRQARQWLDRQDLPPTLLVPGNHEALLRENSAAKRAMWEPWLHRSKLYPALSVLEQDGVALIGVNTARPSLPFLATGSAGEAQLAQLAQCLSQSRAAGLCRVVLLHHPPVAGLVSTRKGLTDLEAFQAVLRQNGAELVLHGHSHRATFTRLAGSAIPVLGTTSASHTPDTPATAAGWNLITITPQPDRWAITVQRRALTPGGSMTDCAEYHAFTADRFLPPSAL
ncbi:metallophosphoesterase family protein [Acetobacter garciniae]|uniref:metallophosphoesterase family protein n=1 Tax=Acetobacter garciniae TaxID=2817435 RepID=UPI001E4B9890|nr:metallophosphoesterase [Acetobacter garciniae]